MDAVFAWAAMAAAVFLPPGGSEPAPRHDAARSEAQAVPVRADTTSAVPGDPTATDEVRPLWASPGPGAAGPPPFTLAAAALPGNAAYTAAMLVVAEQEEKLRERQVLDPDSDEWMPTSAPVEGTPQGDLEWARSWLARGEPNKARKILKKWVKANPDDERRIEAEFLLGEAEFERGDYWAAYKRYNYVTENTGGEVYHRAVRREMDVARAFLAGKKRIVWKILRLPAYDSGVDILDKVWQHVPGTRAGEDALRLRADYHYGRGDMDFAQDEYATLAREYPRGRFTQYAMLRSAQSADAAFEGIRYDDRPLLEAEERYKQVELAYPGYAERAAVGERLNGIREKRAEKDLDVARWYLKTDRRDAAEFYLRRVRTVYAGTLAAEEAKGRLRRMGVEVEEGG